MGSTIGQFDYAILGARKPKVDEIQMPPIIQLRLKRWSSDNNNKTPVISPDLISEAEIDGHIQALKDDLDAIGKRAKAAIRRAVGWHKLNSN